MGAALSLVVVAAVGGLKREVLVSEEWVGKELVAWAPPFPFYRAVPRERFTTSADS